MHGSHLLAVAAAGSVGAVARLLMVAGVQAVWPGSTWAIAAVNLAGCVGFGVCFGLGADRWPPLLAAAVLVGFFGAFTTFSTYAFECHAQLVARQWGVLLANLLLHNVVGIAALAAGIAAGRAFARAA